MVEQEKQNIVRRQEEKKEKARNTVRAGISATAIAAAVLAVAVPPGASALITSAQWRQGNVTPAPTTAAIKTEHVIIAIEGMHCSSCSSGITAMLKRTPGVTSADASYERKEAVVEFDPSRTSSEKIIEVINNLGYKATLKS